MEANGGRERRALTYDDRLEIERGLNRGDRIAWIARTIGRAPKVVADEVRRNWTDDPQGMPVVRTRNICTKAAGCQARGAVQGDVQDALQQVQGLPLQLAVRGVRGEALPAARRDAVLLQRLPAEAWKRMQASL